MSVSFVAGVVVAASPEDDISDSARSIWDTFVDALPRVGVAAAMVLIGWVLSRAVRWAMRRALLRSRTPSFARVMSKVTSWVVLFVVALLAIAVTFPSVKPVDLLAGLGFFSVAVGFAFQDILENTLAGILLLFRQPFRSGDQIEVVGQSGTVTEINIRETRLTTFDGEAVLIPNRDVYKNAIVVHTAHASHRITFDVGIAYENDAIEATRAIVDALAGVTGVETVPAPDALVTDLGPSTVKIQVMFWTPSRHYESIVVLDAAIKAVKARLDHDGIEMPADIVVLQGTPSFRAALHDRPGTTQGGYLRPDDPPPSD